MSSQLSRYLLILTLCLTCWSCDIFKSTSSSDCGPADTDQLSFNAASLAFASPLMETTFAGGRRTFSWSMLVDNVCTGEHARATWELAVNRDQLPAGWRVDAGYVLNLAFGDDVTLTPSDVNTFRNYLGQTNIGLEQIFKAGPGLFLMVLEISFPSNGDLSADRTTAQRLFAHLQLTANYKEHKSS